MHKLIKKYQTGDRMSKLTANPAYLTVSPGADITKITSGFKSTLDKQLSSSGMLPPSTGAAFGQVGLGLLGQAPQMLDAGLQLFGGKKATGSAGEEFGMGVMDSVAGGLMKSGNPYAMLGGAALMGVSALNRYGGKTAKEQGTQGLNTGAYAFQASVNAGKKQTLLGTWGGKVKKADAMTVNTDRMNLMAGNAGYQNTQNLLSAQNTFGDIATKNKQSLLGGINTNILSAKKGAKVNPAKLRNITKKAKKKEFVNLDKPEETVTKFEEGGKLNVIPEGALHARKHNLPEEIANQVTDKGIPVVTYNEGGEITQHAEIELNEIIFHKETTNKLEELFKVYNDTESEEEKNNIAIECGKFLASEILENTDDKTGLLNEIE